MLRLLVPTILALALNSVDTLMAGVITMDYTGSTWTVSGHNTVFDDASDAYNGLASDPATLTGGHIHLDVSVTTAGGLYSSLWYSNSAGQFEASSNAYDSQTDGLSFSIQFLGDVVWAGVIKYPESSFPQTGGGSFTIGEFHQAKDTGTITGAPSLGGSLRGFTALVNLEKASSPYSYSVDFISVPEPSTAIAMGLLGVLGFAGNRRRRRQS